MKVKKGEFKVKKGEFKVKKREFKVKKGEFKVKKGEFIENLLIKYNVDNVNKFTKKWS